MYLTRLKIAGFSLIELMLVIGFVAFIVITFTTTFGSLNGMIKKDHNRALLNRDLQSLMTIMAKDIRRAGYWSAAANDVDSGANNNPFMQTATDVQISNNQQCILFTYDARETGDLPTLNDTNGDDRFGFRLSNSAIQWRPSSAAFSCDATANSWEDISDAQKMSITNLQFTQTTRSRSQTLSDGRTQTIVTRLITVSLTASLVADSSITRSLTRVIRLRNNDISFAS